MHIVGALQRAPYGDALLRIETRDHSVVFDVQLLLRAGGVFRFDDVVGVLKRAFYISLINEVGFEDIIRAPNNFRKLLAFLDSEDRWKRVIFDGNGFNCFSQKISVRVREEEDGFLGMIDQYFREAGLILPD